MNTENQYKEEQEVWVKHIIINPNLDKDGEIQLKRHYKGGYITVYALPSEIRTTEQIWKDVITRDSKSDKFRVYIDDVRQGLNYYYIYAPDGTEAVLQKDCYSPREVIEICDRENAKIASQNSELPAQNAEPSEGDECWVRATYVGKAFHHDESSVKIETPGLVERTSYIDVKDKDIHFTKPQTTAVDEPDRTRYFKKGDKVQRRKKIDGRDLSKTCPSIPFDEIFTIAEDEKDPWEVKIKWGDRTGQGGFIYFELVEPAPEEKFFIEDETSYDSYTINFGTPDDYQFVAKLDTDFYTLEEARQECENLSKKD